MFYPSQKLQAENCSNLFLAESRNFFSCYLLSNEGEVLHIYAPVKNLQFDVLLKFICLDIILSSLFFAHVIRIIYVPQI